jgi:hypothetical protein
MKNFIYGSVLLVLISSLLFPGCSDNSVTPTSGNMPVVASLPESSPCISTFVTTFSGNDIAFVSLYNGGLEILNVNNPASPQSIGNYNVSGNLVEVYATGINNVPHAFLAATSGGVSIINCSNINNPTLDTTIVISGDSVGTVFADSSSKILYVGCGSGKMYVYDINNLPGVNYLTTYTSASNINEIVVVNNVAYLAEDSGLDILNVTNPSSPSRLALGTSNDVAYDIKITGHYAIIANALNGVLVLNVSSPSNPQIVSYLETTDVGLACAINGNLVYVAEDVTGVETFDISNPSNPTYQANYVTGSYSEHVYFYKGYTYVADYNSLVVLKYP